VDGTAERLDDGPGGGAQVARLARVRLAPMAVAGALLLAPYPPAAGLPAFAQLLPQATAEEAFAEPYGRAVTMKLGRILEESAEPTCLVDKRLAPADLAKAGEALLVKYGQRMIDRVRGHVDAKAAEAHFARLAGPGATDELRTLTRDPLVAEMLALRRPADLDRIVVLTAETFDRYVLLRRIRMARPVSPLADASDLVHASRIEDAESRVARMMEEHKGSDLLRRYLQLVEAARQAVAAALDHEAHMKVGPAEEFAGLDEDLRAVCVGNM
jgi:hypothetical protein